MHYVMQQRIVRRVAEAAGQAVVQDVEMGRWVTALAPARVHVVIARLDARRPEIGIAGEIVVRVDQPTREAGGATGVGPRDCIDPVAEPGLQVVQEGIDVGVTQEGMRGEVLRR